MNVEMLRAFFGWCTLLNWAAMLVAVFFMTIARGITIRIHSKMWGVAEEDVARYIYVMMMWYKTAVILFCLVPYLVLRIIA